jgi:hypothetical protein
MSLGLLIMVLLLPKPFTLGGVTFDIHTMLYASAAIILGFQMIAFALFSKVFAVNTKLLPEDSRIDFIKKRPVLEIGICLGFLLFLLGITGSVSAVTRWESAAFGPLIPGAIMRVVIPSVTALILGIQLILSSFFIAILQLSRRYL